MKTKRIVSLLLSVLLVVSTFCIAGTMTVSAADETTYPEAAAQLDKDYAYSGNDLGAIYSPESTTFKLWAPTATDVKVNLYTTGSDTEEGAKKLSTTDMTNTNGVWSVKIDGDQKNVYYTYTVTAKSIKKETVTTKETIDPYAQAAGVNGKRGMIVDLDSTDPEGWENDNHVLLDKSTEASVWEVQIKDFSYNENSGVSAKNRGKYMAFTELNTTLNNAGDVATGISYLKELGITHVQINPFYDFGSIDEAGADTQFNWGYDPMNYNVPEGSFSSNPYDGNVRINECKAMIKALHDAGIGVIMDVVYNHTYNTNTSFQAAVPDYYYRMTENGTFVSGSGCGNDTASERAMFRKFMIDSTEYWVNEYHVDGFRFDLMGLHDVETMNKIRENLDKIDSRLIMYGEGWTMTTQFDPKTCDGTDTISASQANAKSSLNTRIACFSDSIRDGLKGNVFDKLATGFLQGSKSNAGKVAYGVRANTQNKSPWMSAQPSQTVTYVSCHDNQTLYDRLVASVYGPDVDFRARYANIVEMNKLSAAIINTSQGINFMVAGEEMARSKDNDENSYKSPATLNMIDWNNLVKYGDVVSYYKGMSQIRKAFSPFTADDNSFFDNYQFTNAVSTATGTMSYVVSNTTEGEWQNMGVIYNSLTTEAEVEFKSDITDWVIVADKTSAGVKKLGEVQGKTIKVAPQSALILVDKASFEAVNLKSNTSTITVNHLNSKNEVMSTQKIIGEPGEGYQTSEDAQFELKYVVSKIEGDAKGVFTEEDKTVSYYYKDFIPASLDDSNDITGDGKITIREATAIQKHIIDVKKIDEELLPKADYNYDGKLNIRDATMVQKYLIEKPVGIGTVVSNYYYYDEDGVKTQLTPSITREYRVGTQYQTTAAQKNSYTLKETPANATGTVAFGVTNVDYYYDYSGVEITVYVKHNGTETWVPNLWFWDDNKVDAFTQWPGEAFSETTDSDGWHSLTFSMPGDADYNMIVSNNGSPQTADYTGLSKDSNKFWVVIDDAKVTDKGEWITVTTEKP